MRILKKAYVGLIFLFLYAPIILLMLFSFNNSRSRGQWGGFTLKWYKELFQDSAIMNALGNPIIVRYAILVPAAILLSLVSVFGDLVASMIKRQFGIKDYGKIFPGHGGIMDRFDSVLMVAPIVYFLMKFIPVILPA